MTNNAMMGNRAQLDLAFATFDTHTSSVTVVPDQMLSAVSVNAFNSHSGLVANLYPHPQVSECSV